MFEYFSALSLAPVVRDLLESSTDSPMWFVRCTSNWGDPNIYSLSAIVESRGVYTISDIDATIAWRGVWPGHVSIQRSQIAGAEPRRSRIVISRLETTLLRNKVAKQMRGRGLYDGGYYWALYTKGSSRAFFSVASISRNAFKEYACCRLRVFVERTLSNHWGIAS